ncbi:hypothetical protein BATDEDRAFT_24394 [Batrachochytrium dendrobatidis JAM81]|uniref:Uncharacterized protein n=1 Tax=Batrachochytrium dendrobatidis (strain JAM81 / FGSC 10211) TaxID=684364 RepID=F4P1F3_BATDJ|nr:uncharacterized protein BATDEDRAFT_24394 [Batrachochytrium dendrobatidis JAM81]EGF80626.1 hypothetical protein BATDEDRAFT_24394 [Batrachochytrium dendrobatidis JAM81]|eukprot:XP_006678440.1 hypothetical protein BATDEDRAFT_24394 [Batrachochytrium dendrobatidis JAM81]
MSAKISIADKQQPWRPVNKKSLDESTTFTSLHTGPDPLLILARSSRPSVSSVVNTLQEELFDVLHAKSSLSTRAHNKYHVSAGTQRITKPRISLKPHCSASYFLQITSTWDKGNRSVREKILREFVASNDNKIGPQIEKEFGNGASLFLTRISAWLRLTQRDKAEALRLIQCVANSGRKYKEFICESFGVRQVTECLSKSRSEITQDYARNLLTELGTGNPKFHMQVFKGLQSLLSSQAVSPTAQQMSGQAIRSLLPSIPNVPLNFIDPTLALLKSPHIQVQYEGYEILKELITRPPLQDLLLTQLIAILCNIVDDKTDDVSDDRHRRTKSDQKGLVGQWNEISVEEQKEKQVIMSGYIQQAYVAKLLGIVAATDKELAERMVQLQLIRGLLNVVANISHPESQKYATNTLLYFVSSIDYVGAFLKEHMGSNFFDLLENRPDTFYRELTKEQVRYLRRNTFKIKRVNSRHSLASSGSGSESSDDESGQKTGRHSGYSKKDIASFPSTNAQKEQKLVENFYAPNVETKANQETIMDGYENTDIGAGNAPPIENLYTPFLQATTKTTFAGNKYATGVSLNEGTKVFSTELDKFRVTAFKNKKRDGKKEFEATYQDEMQARLTNMKTDPKLFSKEMAINGDMERKRVPMPRPKSKKDADRISKCGALIPLSPNPEDPTNVNFLLDIPNPDQSQNIENDLNNSGETQEPFNETASLLEISGKQDFFPEEVIETPYEHHYSSGNISYRSSLSSNASDGDDEIIGEEQDYFVALVHPEHVEEAVGDVIKETIDDVVEEEEEATEVV